MGHRQTAYHDKNKEMAKLDFTDYWEKVMAGWSPKLRDEFDRLLKIEIEMQERKYGLISDWTCPQLWQRMSILFNGTILPCNHDDREFAALGNYNSMSISKAWRNVNFMREIHRKKEADLIDACDGCFLRTSEILNLRE